MKTEQEIRELLQWYENETYNKKNPKSIREDYAGKFLLLKHILNDPYEKGVNKK